MRFLSIIAGLCALAAIGVYFSVDSSQSFPNAGTPRIDGRPSTPPIEIPAMPFSDITRQAGIAFVHQNGAAGEKLLPETMGGGCAFLDYDGDGDQDLLLTNSQSWPHDTSPQSASSTMALYENNGTGSFQDVTQLAGLNVPFYGMGVAVGDYDADGRTDLFFPALGENRLFRNVGKRFEEVTDAAGVGGAHDAWSTSAGWFDADSDGDLDLFVCNYVEWSREYDLAQNFRFQDGGRAYGRPQNFEGTYPYLYRNDGNGTFTDISAQAGLQIDDAAGRPLAKSLGVVFADLDSDGHIDVVVANDTVRNLCFRNQGNGTFAETGMISGIAFDPWGSARGAMGIDAARFRNSDEIGVAIGNFANEMMALYVTGPGVLQFTDEAVLNGLGPSTLLQLTFGLFFFDCDLDGRLDLFAANGHLENEINRVQENQHYAQSPQLFWNCGPGNEREFIPVPAESVGEDFHRPLVGRGAAYADIDGDGDLDLLIATTGSPPRLLRNDQHLKRHWLRVKLIGSGGNRDAIGARVDLHVADRTLRGRVMPTRSYLSQVELPVTFGLGASESNASDQAMQLSIHWPDGTHQRVDVNQVDRLIEIHQP